MRSPDRAVSVAPVTWTTRERSEWSGPSIDGATPPDMRIAIRLDGRMVRSEGGLTRDGAAPPPRVKRAGRTGRGQTNPRQRKSDGARRTAIRQLAALRMDMID